VPVMYKDIEGFPGYRVGSDGTVWTLYEAKGGSLPGGVGQGGMKLGTKWKPLKASPAGNDKGLRVGLCGRDGKRVSRFVSNLVLEAFVGPRPEGMVCRHGPLGKYCNNLTNLQWGTQKENIADKYRDGTRIFGVKHHEAKMTPETVRQARIEYATGVSCLSLSKKYGISCNTMRAVLKRQTWKEVA
jgi:hypothetical protein